VGDSIYQILFPPGLGERSETLLIETNDNVLESIDGVGSDSLALELWRLILSIP
jgi:hypothetical protein